ncbi:hypothetical protein Ahy_B10g104744 [Arachis hypogaea]|uniref:Aminotransferase-like plant mobile domain-containing protein n=1 Tax=Arachis hypogaea TaxID=3818 RepID=A0A444X6E4_ARAHY|nr:hypothetical protein Ahy_B10g104744 [Arachis hypogaea]
MISKSCWLLQCVSDLKNSKTNGPGQYLSRKVESSDSYVPFSYRIQTYSWGSACLVHLYRSQCRATQYDCKDLDGSLALLWNECDCPSMEYKWLTLAHVRQMLDNITNINFLWDPYSPRHLGTDFVLHDMYEDARMWLASSPLISFKCIEWCPTDRVKRQFGRRQDSSDNAKVFGNAHNMLLTGPKNLNWAQEWSEWINLWQDRQWGVLGAEMIENFDPSNDYIDWHHQEYAEHL